MRKILNRRLFSLKDTFIASTGHPLSLNGTVHPLSPHPHLPKKKFASLYCAGKQKRLRVQNRPIKKELVLEKSTM